MQPLPLALSLCLITSSASAFQIPTPASTVGDVLDEMDKSIQRIEATTLSNTNIVSGNAFELASALVSELTYSLAKERKDTMSDLGDQRYAAIKEVANLLDKLERNTLTLLSKTQAKVEFSVTTSTVENILSIHPYRSGNPTLIYREAPQTVTLNGVGFGLAGNPYVYYTTVTINGKQVDSDIAVVDPQPDGIRIPLSPTFLNPLFKDGKINTIPIQVHSEIDRPVGLSALKSARVMIAVHSCTTSGFTQRLWERLQSSPAGQSKSSIPAH